MQSTLAALRRPKWQSIPLLIVMPATGLGLVPDYD